MKKWMLLFIALVLVGAASKPVSDPCAQYGNPWVPNLKYNVVIDTVKFSPKQESYPYGAFVYVKDANGQLIANPVGVASYDYTTGSVYCVDNSVTPAKSVKLGVNGVGCYNPKLPVYDPPAYAKCKGLA